MLELIHECDEHFGECTLLCREQFDILYEELNLAKEKIQFCFLPNGNVKLNCWYPVVHRIDQRRIEKLKGEGNAN